MTEVSPATSTDVTPGTPDNSDSTDNSLNTATSDSEGGRANAPSNEENVQVDLESVPQELRSHVEKYAKKYENDFKSAYTKKFQALSAKERLWEQEKNRYESERTMAMEALKDPKKLNAIKTLYGITDTQESENAEPPQFKTVGDLVDWNKQQLSKEMEKYKASITAEAEKAVLNTTVVQKWDTALKSVSKDKHFSKYKDIIVEIAKKDEGLQSQYRAGEINEEDVLKKAQDNFKQMLREDMENIKQETLAAQRKKTSTSLPTQTIPLANSGAKGRDEVIARVRARLGSAS